MAPRDRRAAESVTAGVFRRALQVVAAFVRHAFVPWLLRRRTPSRAERAQAALEELGGTWVKLGQALALRFDVLPADYCVQLFQLLNQVKPFPFADARRIVEEDLGKPLDALFRSFEETPVAAASIGQVHRAELPDGTVVAVKVQRPGIARLVRADLKLMRALAWLLDATPLFGPTRALDLVTEFARWTDEELDYRVEARHAIVLARHAEGDPFERNARVHTAYTAARVLTLDYLEGPSVIDVVSAKRRGDTAFLADLAAKGHDTRRIASHIVWNALNQIYRFGYFHADPHPANLIVLPDDAIGYVDFGIVGKLDDKTTDSLRHFAQSLFAGRVGAAVDEFILFLTPSEKTDVLAARRDLVEAMSSYLESARVGPEGLSAAEDVFEIEILGVVRAHAMSLAPDAVRYLKAVLTAEAMVKELDPDFDLRAHENLFFSRLMQLEARESLDPRRLGIRLLDVRHRVERLLETAEGAREAPARVLAVAQDVRRRVQLFAVLTMLGWLAAAGAIWTARGGLGPVALGGAVVSLVLLVFSVLQVRRLPSDSELGRMVPYPRRVR